MYVIHVGDEMFQVRQVLKEQSDIQVLLVSLDNEDLAGSKGQLDLRDRLVPGDRREEEEEEEVHKEFLDLEARQVWVVEVLISLLYLRQ